MRRRTASPPPELITFSVDDRQSLLTVMRRMLRDRDGWLNLQAAVEAQDVPDEGGGIARMFSASGPAVPLGSWVPGARRRRGVPEPVSVGLQHAGGPRALARLSELGHPPAEQWRMLSDHPRRGFVLEVPAGEDPDVALVWLLRAAELLASVELPRRWHAGVIPRR